VFGNHWIYLILLLVVVLIIFGPGRLPELGGALGRAMREFRKTTSEISNEINTAVQQKPEQPAAGDAAKASTSETKPSNN
jgi:sec-independent protein translocase protein TatA